MLDSKKKLTFNLSQKQDASLHHPQSRQWLMAMRLRANQPTATLNSQKHMHTFQLVMRELGIDWADEFKKLYDRRVNVHNEKFPEQISREKENHTIIHVSLLTPLEPFFVRNSIHHPLYFSCHPSISTSSSPSSSLRVSAPPWKPWGRSKPQKARAVSRPIHINA